MNSVMESSLIEGNIIVEPVDQNLNLSTAPLTEGNIVKSGGNKVVESSLRKENNIESTGPLYAESDKDSSGTTPSKNLGGNTIVGKHENFCGNINVGSMESRSERSYSGTTPSKNLGGNAIVETGSSGGTTPLRKSGGIGLMSNSIKNYFTQSPKISVGVEVGKPSKAEGGVVIDSLFEAASNIRQLREASGQCIVVKKWCTLHDSEAIRKSWNKQMWLRNKKTGLYSYKMRKVSVLSCDRNTNPLLGTMDLVDGAGVKKEGKSCGQVAHR